jgi:hypothetical protein
MTSNFGLLMDTASAAWHRQAGTNCGELKDLGVWKTRSMADRSARYATGHLAVRVTSVSFFQWSFEG